MARGTGARDAAAGAEAVIAGARAYKNSQDSDRDFSYKKDEDAKSQARQAIQDEIHKRFLDSQMQNMEIERSLKANELRDRYPFYDTRPDDPKGNNIPTGRPVPFTDQEKLGSMNDTRNSAGLPSMASADELLPQRDVAAYKLSQDTGQAKLAHINAQTGAEQSKTGYYDRGGKAAAPSKISGPIGDILDGVNHISEMNKQADQLLSSDDPDDREQGQNMKLAAGIAKSHFMAQLAADQKPKKNNITAKYNKATGENYLEGTFQDPESAQEFIRNQSLASAQQKSQEADADAAGAQTSFLDHVPFVSAYGNQHEKQAAAASAKATLNKLQQYGTPPPPAAAGDEATPAPAVVAPAPAPSGVLSSGFGFPGVKGTPSEAPASALNAPAPAIAPTQSKEAPVVSSQKDFDALPKGAQYYNKIKGRYETKP